MESKIPTSCFIISYFGISFFLILLIFLYFLIPRILSNIKKRSILWGILIWIISIEIIFNLLVYFVYNPFSKSENNFIKFLHSFIQGISPPILEEFGRLICFLFLFKSKNFHFNNSIMYGTGHGGFEALVMYATKNINKLIHFYEINNKSNITEITKNDDLNKFYKDYKDGIPVDDYIDLFMRLFAYVFHISASILVYSFSLDMKKNITHFIVAFVFHLIIDLEYNLIVDFNLNKWIKISYIGIYIIFSIYSYFVWRKNTIEANPDLNEEEDDLLEDIKNKDGHSSTECQVLP